MERIAQASAGFQSITEKIDTTTPAGRMMMQMIGSFAEFERAMIRERTSAGILQPTALPDGTVQTLVPVTFTRGEPGQAAQQATFLISQTIIRDPNGWHVARILPIADTHLK